MKKKTKIKWLNIVLTLIFLLCLYVVLHDLYMITIYSWINNQLVSWSWFGLIIFLLALTIGGEIFEYFIEETTK